MKQKQLFQCYSPLQSYSLGHWNWWQWLQLRCQSYTRGNRMGLPLLSFFVKMGLPPLGITTRSKHHKSSCNWTRPYYIPSFQIGGTLSPSSPMYKTLWVNDYGGDLDLNNRQSKKMLCQLWWWLGSHLKGNHPRIEWILTLPLLLASLISKCDDAFWGMICRNNIIKRLWISCF